MRPVPSNSSNAGSQSQSSSDDSNALALNDMWGSLAACNPMDLPASGMVKDGTSTTVTAHERNIKLPSQAQATQDESNVVSSAHSVDGLVLVFVTSRDTDRIHCFDVTVRCTPPSTASTKDGNTPSSTNSTAGPDKDLEDLDGWRGYIAPLQGRSNKPKASSSAATNTGGTSAEDRIVAEHMGASGGNDSSKEKEGIVGIATARASSGHRPVHMACISGNNLVLMILVAFVDVLKLPSHLRSCPLNGSRRPLSTPPRTEAPLFTLSSPWQQESYGKLSAVDIVPGIVAVGTDKGGIHVFTYGGGKHVLRSYLRIPSPPSNDMSVVQCKISMGPDKASVFVAYRRRKSSGSVSSPRSTAGVSCFDMPLPKGANPPPVSAPSARHDLDGRNVLSSSLCDAVTTEKDETLFTAARPDGLYTYSTTQKVDVSPIDGSKLAICLVPPPKSAGASRTPASGKSGSSFALVASTDTKSRRDAVDIYDSTNKLVAFHLLLSPGHTAVQAAGVATPPTRNADGSIRTGRSSAIVFTSGGSLVTLTEKGTAEKVHLLVQKNLYSAAIFVAYADPSYETEDITMLFRRHAEYLYRKGDYSGAIDQYKHTIGSLEPSHVIFRYLDAPKIPLLVKYLEELRLKGLTTPVHNELLRTCYLKLNDPESAEAIAAFTSRSMDTDSLSTMVANAPKDALATICSFDASQAAQALAVYGASLARLLPRETAGLVVSLCLGTFSPRALSESSTTVIADTKKFLEHPTDVNEQAHDPYPVHVFAYCFMENPKMLRLILTHCNRNKCPLTPSLRRTLLELTLAEWNQAKRTGDTEAEKIRRKEAIAALTDSHCREIGDYDALVIVQLAGFEEGELLLYERLQMGPILLSRYAKDGSEKARRQMLAMCQSDPEVLADVLGYFVGMVTERHADAETDKDGNESDDEIGEILEDIQEALALARRQGVLPPVRIARILAGEGTGRFSTNTAPDKSQQRTVPLSVALDYVGDILDESRREISRLKIEVDEYNQLCNSMEAEIDSLLRASHAVPSNRELCEEVSPRINVEEMYVKTRQALEDGEQQDRAELSREAFWREMDQSEDTFQTIARFFSKGVIQ
ncbi:MAG: hypothetical protein SGILL_000298 [Bacillariaceae sp.]